mmetsp:Transcript_21466/g.26296  ORF Transcript_21466/g.26296 Transcript_21466/m.26296 type:complete len:686 (+) Transcript_21466:31-2088(+)
MGFGQSAPSQPAYTQLPTRPPGRRMGRNNRTGTSRRDLYDNSTDRSSRQDLDVSFIPNRRMQRLSTMTDSCEHDFFRESHERDEVTPKKRRTWIVLIGINLLIGAAAGVEYFLHPIHRHFNEPKILTAASVVTLVPPPDDIHIACSIHSLRTEFGTMACRDACQPAECCLLPLSHDQSCLLPMRLECMGYSSCLNLSRSSTVSKQVTVVPPPPSNLGSVCEKSALNEVTALEDCQRLCEVANCCVADGSGGSCIADNLATCGEYHSCFVLLNDDDIIPNLEDEEALEQKPTTSSTGQSQGSFSQGFAPYNSGSDDTDNGILTWDTAEVPNVAPKIPEVRDATNVEPSTSLQIYPSDEISNLQTICSPTSSDLTNCALECHEAKCCFTTSTHEMGCRDTHKPLCDMYRPCEILYRQNENPDAKPAAPTTSDASDNKVQSTATTTTTTTSRTNAQCVDTTSFKGLMDCQEFCMRYKCCFLASAENGCGNNAGIGIQCFEHRFCEGFFELVYKKETTYEKAKSVTTQTVEYPVAPNVTSLTDKNQLVSSTQEKRDQAFPTDVVNLVEENPSVTTTTVGYPTPPDTMLLDQTGTTRPINDTAIRPTNAALHLADEIAYVCSPPQISKGGHAACQNGCRSGSCCFAKDTGKPNLRSMNCTPSFCETYQPCGILQQTTTTLLSSNASFSNP